LILFILFNFNLPIIWAAACAACAAPNTKVQPKPEGNLIDDHKSSWRAFKSVTGGQLITGIVVFEAATGPKPFDKPAQANN
jgi:hypothetical protein